MSDTVTQRSIVLEYYQNHPNRDIKHPEIVDWVTAEYARRTGRGGLLKGTLGLVGHSGGRTMRAHEAIQRTNEECIRD